MKIFGYAKRTVNEYGLLELKEISLQTDPHILREIAGFLLCSADSMEKHGKDFVHEHFKDRRTDRSDDFPDVIVVRPGI